MALKIVRYHNSKTTHTYLHVKYFVVKIYLNVPPPVNKIPK